MRLVVRSICIVRAALLLCLCSQFMGCAHLSGPPAVSDNVFRVRYQRDLNNFDWNMTSDSINSWVLRNIMEGLFEISSDGELRPRLVEAYTVSRDARTYVFTIRDGVTWSDGVPLRAEDFYFSWKRLLDPSTGSPNADLLFAVEGAEDYHQGRIKDFAKVGIKLEGERVIRVHLGRAAPFFPMMLSMWATFPIRKDVIAKFGSEWTRPGNVVVLGPYITALVEEGVRTVLRRNDRYYGPRPAIDAIEMTLVFDDEQSIAQFRQGRFDQLWVALPAKARTVLPDAEFRSEKVPWTAFLFFNANSGALAAPRVRQAIAMAVDKTAIASKLDGSIQVASSLVTPDVLPLGDETAVEFDPVRARALLGKERARLGRREPFELVGLDSELHRMIMGVVKDELERNLGLRVEVRPMERAAFERALVDGGAKRIFFQVNYADYLDPYAVLRIFLSHSSTYPLRWRDAGFDSLVARALAQPNARRRALLYRESLLRLQRDQAHAVPLFHRHVDYFLSSRVRNFRRTPVGDVYFRDVSLAPRGDGGAHGP